MSKILDNPRGKNLQAVLLGEATVGKTSLVSKLIKDTFTEETSATIGASFSCTTFNNIKYNFWDTAGQERYLSLVPMYYRKGDIIFLVFDTSRLSTIDRLVHYLKKIREDLVSSNYEVIVVGTKTDLSTCSIEYINELLEEKLGEFMDIIGDSIDCIYVSSKNGTNFDKLLERLKEKGNILQGINVTQESDKQIVSLVANDGYVNKLSCGYC